MKKLPLSDENDDKKFADLVRTVSLNDEEQTIGEVAPTTVMPLAHLPPAKEQVTDASR